MLLIGSGWQAISVQSERQEYAPLGQYINVGSYKAHCYIEGEGEFAFVFITGSGTPCAYTDFYELQKTLASVGETITFDHAGFGWSTETKVPRTIQNLTQELHSIIEEVALDKQIILICHSLGSLEAINYTQVYPDKVAGRINVMSSYLAQ